jgi:hypothetical protein
VSTSVSTSWWSHCIRCGAEGPISGNALGLCLACEAAVRAAGGQSSGHPAVYLSDADVQRIAEAVARRIARLLQERGGGLS